MIFSRRSLVRVLAMVIAGLGWGLGGLSVESAPERLRSGARAVFP